MLRATGLAALGLGTTWVGVSDSWKARLIRAPFKDAMRRVPAAKATPTPASWNNNGISLAWIGHATVLINFYGVNIITDPIWNSYAGPTSLFGNFGPKRFILPALPFNQLPKIDLVMLSHAHMDHMDRSTLRLFSSQTAAVTAKHTADILTSTSVAGARELAWGETTTFKFAAGEIAIRAFQVRHWGARWRKDQHRGYNGYVLSREGKSIYFGGDSAYTDLFGSIKQYGPFEVGIMPIGAYNPWRGSHCSPEEGVTMANMSGAKIIAPIHHKTFKLSDEPMDEPIERFTKALEQELPRIAWSDPGESCILKV